MYIRRKVFSLLQDESGQEKYFSTTEFDYDVEEKTFAEKKFEDTKSSRGNGRASALGGLSGVIGRAAGNRAATKAAKAGKSDQEVMHSGKNVATGVGAALGAGVGAGVGYANASNKVCGKAARALRVNAADRIREVGRKVNNKTAKKVIEKIARNPKAAIAATTGTIAATAAAMGARAGVKKAIKDRKGVD